MHFSCCKMSNIQFRKQFKVCYFWLLQTVVLICFFFTFKLETYAIKYICIKQPQNIHEARYSNYMLYSLALKWLSVLICIVGALDRGPFRYLYLDLSKVLEKGCTFVQNKKWLWSAKVVKLTNSSPFHFLCENF